MIALAHTHAPNFTGTSYLIGAAIFAGLAIMATWAMWPTIRANLGPRVFERTESDLRYRYMTPDEIAWESYQGWPHVR